MLPGSPLRYFLVKKSSPASCGNLCAKKHGFKRPVGDGLCNDEVTKLIDIFVVNKLGSEMDTIFCIIPIVVAMGVSYQELLQLGMFKW